MTVRYAVFYSPDDNSGLARFGACALGRDAAGNRVPADANDFPDSPISSAVRATPAHYGFHATLKAPFQLAAGRCEEQLLDAVAKLSQPQSAISLYTLAPRLLDGFFALTLQNQPEAVSCLAEHCVRTLEPFRAPLSDADLLRRKPDSLTELQRNYLFEFGYPFVMTEFRFHMTLTGKLSAHDHTDYLQWLNKQYGRLVTTVPTVDRLAVFRQPDRATAFTRLAEFAFL